MNRPGILMLERIAKRKAASRAFEENHRRAALMRQGYTVQPVDVPAADRDVRMTREAMWMRAVRS